MTINEKKAEKLFKHYLTMIYKLVGKNTTYLSQLEGSGKLLLGVKFKGVFPSDKIPRLNDLSPYAIINLDNSKESGSHWIAIAKKDDKTLVFDSFGRSYKRIIPQLNLTGNGRIINTDLDVDQKVKQTDCGARSLCWILLYDNHGWNVAKHI